MPKVVYYIHMLSISQGGFDEIQGCHRARRSADGRDCGRAWNSEIFFFFNNLSPKTSVDKLLAATKAVRVFGARGADDNTLCEIPETVPFEQFLKYKIEHNPEGYAFRWLEKSRYSELKK